MGIEDIRRERQGGDGSGADVTRVAASVREAGSPSGEPGLNEDEPRRAGGPNAVRRMDATPWDAREVDPEPETPDEGVSAPGDPGPNFGQLVSRIRDFVDDDEREETKQRQKGRTKARKNERERARRGRGEKLPSDRLREVAGTGSPRAEREPDFEPKDTTGPFQVVRRVLGL